MKIVVDKLPDSCHKCLFGKEQDHLSVKYETVYRCILLEGNFTEYKIPSECPLIVFE